MTLCKTKYFFWRRVFQVMHPLKASIHSIGNPLTCYYSFICEESRIINHHTTHTASELVKISYMQPFSFSSAGLERSQRVRVIHTFGFWEGFSYNISRESIFPSPCLPSLAGVGDRCLKCLERWSQKGSVRQNSLCHSLSGVALHQTLRHRRCHYLFLHKTLFVKKSQLWDFHIDAFPAGKAASSPKSPLSQSCSHMWFYQFSLGKWGTTHSHIHLLRGTWSSRT